VTRPNRFTLVAALAAAVAVTVIALAASGGADTQLVSGSAIAQAARATEKIPGASVLMDATIDVDGLDEPLKMHLEGVEDVRGRTGRVAGGYSNFPKKVPGEDADGNVPVEIVALSPDVYMKSPLFDSFLPEGKPWLHVDVARTSKRLGVGDPAQFSQMDPSGTVGNLRATSDRVERAGTEDVRGVATTHYRATVQLRKLPALVPESRKAMARKNVAKLIQLLGSDSYPIEVWVDRQHLVRRVLVTMKMKIPPQNQQMTMRLTTDLYDFGPKPKAKRPPAGETYDSP
jgi:hypothetical protein